MEKIIKQCRVEINGNWNLTCGVNKFDYCLGATQILDRLEELLANRLEAVVSQAASACAVAEIEFRPDMNDIDEIVANNASLHLEYMNDSSIWMSITIPGKEYHVWINPKNPKSNAHIKTWAEQV